MRKTFLKHSFTLVEILVVVTIIGLLTAGSVVSYSQFQKTSRDSRRKIDLQLVRSALEMYRSNSNVYPTTTEFNSGILVSQNYIDKLPLDPLASQSYSYQYIALPSGCNNVIVLCIDYNYGAYLEQTSTTCNVNPPNYCRGGTGSAPCNYCVYPYGER